MGTLLAAPVCLLLRVVPECRGTSGSDVTVMMALQSCGKLRLLSGRLIGVCLSLASTQNLAHNLCLESDWQYSQTDWAEGCDREQEGDEAIRGKRLTIRGKRPTRTPDRDMKKR